MHRQVPTSTVAGTEQRLKKRSLHFSILPLLPVSCFWEPTGKEDAGWSTYGFNWINQEMRRCICILRWSSQGKWVTSSCLERDCQLMLSPFWLLQWLCLQALLERIRAQNGTAHELWPLTSKAMEVCWVVLMSCTERKAGCVPSKLLTQVLGADSIMLCLLDKLKVGGGCVYRWLSLWLTSQRCWHLGHSFGK